MNIDLEDLTDIDNYFRNLIHQIDTSVPIIIRGVNYNTVDADDFVEFNTLSELPSVSKVVDIDTELSYELKCFSRHTLVRKDKSGKINPHLHFARPYVNLFKSKRYKVNTSCIQFTEPKIVNLDLNSLGNFSENISQQSPKLNLFVLVASFTGRIKQHKES